MFVRKCVHEQILCYNALDAHCQRKTAQSGSTGLPLVCVVHANGRECSFVVETALREHAQASTEVQESTCGLFQPVSTVNV